MNKEIMFKCKSMKAMGKNVKLMKVMKIHEKAMKLKMNKIMNMKI